MLASSPSSQGAQEPSMPFLADFTMISGSGNECRTMAPYSPYSAMIVDLPHVFSVLRHLALLFWNHTYNAITNQLVCHDNDDTVHYTTLRALVSSDLPRFKDNAFILTVFCMGRAGT